MTAYFISVFLKSFFETMHIRLKKLNYNNQCTIRALFNSKYKYACIVFIKQEKLEKLRRDIINLKQEKNKNQFDEILFISTFR
jgi:hypothetical protein